ncbi:MAG TPA: zf-TFIIB domain-containing protein [Rhizobiaceae bacterium]|nr:zf-TFIIB domain-containing protein [Rhizobiaceae bacterium]
MKCPIDNTELMMSDRQGIEIDYCPQCRGVWLDRGELDKIIERANREDDRSSESRDRNLVRDDRYDRRDDHYDRSHKRKKKSLLGDIFDF